MATKLTVIGGHEDGYGATQRRDTWWLEPALIFAGLSAFLVYVNWAIFQAGHYYVEPYLSPFYSPVLFTLPTAAGAAPESLAWFGTWPAWWPSFLPPSPAFFVLMFPATFRLTCYYYRKAYYRAFVGSPPACAVGPMAGKRKYSGETTFLIFQNLHRYALYFALAFIVLLAHDAYLSFFRGGEFGVGVGSIVLTLNVVFLGSYTLGCHSVRHLIGGRDDCMSCGQDTLKYVSWKKVSWLNARHMLFAWTSLFWVAFCDVYVRLVSMDIITDFNTWGA